MPYVPAIRRRRHPMLEDPGVGFVTKLVTEVIIAKYHTRLTDLRSAQCMKTCESRLGDGKVRDLTRRRLRNTLKHRSEISICTSRLDLHRYNSKDAKYRRLVFFLSAGIQILQVSCLSQCFSHSMQFMKIVFYFV